ncbi:hypothetical protein [Desulfovibrio sp.]|uniref:hypothetical protein n=1 Tax=Desulfovibrio sp. TaxID=885 RepID=UPI0035B4A4B4
MTVFMRLPVDAGTFTGHKADSARGVTALSRHAGIIAAGAAMRLQAARGPLGIV